MFISTNEATAKLREHADLDRLGAQRLLATGIAGSPIRTRGATIYDEERVGELGEWEHVPRKLVADACPHGLLVGRLGRDKKLDLTAPPPDQLEAVRGPWRLTSLPRLLVPARARHGVSVPFVVTVSGFILMGAEAVGIEPRGVDWALKLEPPGAWFEQLRGRRWPRGRGGPALFVHGWRTMPGLQSDAS